MRVLELSLRNYRVFEEVDLELPARVIGIFGANGSGKTTLCESMLWALYGRARTPKDHIRTHGLLTDCVVRLVFEHGGSAYTIQRTIKGKNHTTDAQLFVGDLQVATGVSEVDEEIRRLLRMDQQVFRASVFAEQKQLDAFSDVTGAKRKEMVLRLLGIKPVDDARTAARKAARGVRGNAEVVAAKLPDIGGLEEELKASRERAGKAREAASLAARELEAAAARAAAAELELTRSDGVRQRAEKLEVERRTLERQVHGLADRHEELGVRIEQLRADLEELPGLEAELARLAGASHRLEAARVLARVAEEIRQLEAEVEAVPDVDPATALEELRSSEEERDGARNRVARAESERERADADLETAGRAVERAAEADPSQPCPTCGRPLGEDFEQYLAHCREQAREAERRARAAAKTARTEGRALTAAEERLRRAVGMGEAARSASQTRALLAERLEKARGAFAQGAEPFGGEAPDLAALEDEARQAVEADRKLTALRTEARHLAQAQEDALKAEGELVSGRDRLEELGRELAALAFDHEDHERIRRDRDDAAATLEGARRAERDAADEASAAAGEVKGLLGELRQARQLQRRVGEMKDEARYLERVGVLLDGFRDHLVARIGPELSREAEALFRELTNAEYEDLRLGEEDLAIQISDGGSWFPVDRFSGSEVDLANLALRVAISTHLSRVSGADVGMMVLDEVLGSLDQERRDLMVRAMGKLAGRFHQLFVITHAEQVKDQFPASIEVRRVGRRRSQAILV